MDMVYVVSSDGHFSSISNERGYLVKLLGLSAGDGRELMSRGMIGICELGGVKNLVSNFETKSSKAHNLSKS